VPASFCRDSRCERPDRDPGESVHVPATAVKRPISKRPDVERRSWMSSGKIIRLAANSSAMVLASATRRQNRGSAAADEGSLRGRDEPFSSRAAARPARALVRMSTRLRQGRSMSYQRVQDPAESRQSFEEE